MALLVAMSLGIPAQEEDRDAGGEGRTHSSEGDRGFVPIPVLGYAPETGFLLGGMGFLYWSPPNTEQSGGSNTVQTGLLYGTRGVFIAPFAVNLILANGRYKPDLSLFFGRGPSEFFGIGADTEARDKELYTALTAEAEADVLVRIAQDLYAGPVTEFLYQDITEREEGGALDTEDIDGSRGARAVGAGAKAIWDTRRPSLYPVSGRLLSVEGTAFPDAISRHDGHFRWMLDYREYWSPWAQHVLALQFLMEQSLGETPFHYLPTLGGQNILRGYPEGRFRAPLALQAQLEYRFPILWRFGGAVFGAVGQVAQSFDTLTADALPVSAGAGLRFTVDTEQHLNLRMDFAIGREGPLFYVSFMEAF
jgi:hypothetical protein